MNVCQVVGVCVQCPNVCILTQYCSKGSLQDVLQNSDIRLDWMFKMSFATDIASGKVYYPLLVKLLEQSGSSTAIDPHTICLIFAETNQLNPMEIGID